LDSESDSDSDSDSDQARARPSACHCACKVFGKLAALALASERRPFVIVGLLAALSVKEADDDELDDFSL
jgi:hypothetical protein